MQGSFGARREVEGCQCSVVDRADEVHIELATVKQRKCKPGLRHYVIGGRRPGATDDVDRSGEVHVDPDVAIVQAEIGVPDAVLGRGQAGIVPEHYL